MGRVKKPVDENEDQAATRHKLESICNSSSRSEKTSWNRKMDNMVKLISKLTPIEEQILTLMSQKMVIVDAVSELRGLMVKECVHPYEQLVLRDDHILCKFCNKKIAKPSLG